jgi:hypothetical protein
MNGKEVEACPLIRLPCPICCSCTLAYQSYKTLTEHIQSQGTFNLPQQGIDHPNPMVGGLPNISSTSWPNHWLIWIPMVDHDTPRDMASTRPFFYLAPINHHLMNMSIWKSRNHLHPLNLTFWTDHIRRKHWDSGFDKHIFSSRMPKIVQ